MIPAFMLYLSPLLAATVGAIMSLQACAALICSPLQPSDAAPAEGRYRSDRKNTQRLAQHWCFRANLRWQNDARRLKSWLRRAPSTPSRIQLN